MDVFQEIIKLPNFIYEIDNPYRVVVLGGNSCKKMKKYDASIISRLLLDKDKLMKLDSKKDISIEEKIEMANLMIRIQNWLDGRLEEYYSASQIKSYIDKLSPEQINELEKQVAVYNKARNYYRDYIYRK